MSRLPNVHKAYILFGSSRPSGVFIFFFENVYGAIHDIDNAIAFTFDNVYCLFPKLI